MVAPILTVAQAKNAINIKASQPALAAADLDWLNWARNALGPTLETVVAPIERRTETRVVHGGRGVLLLPWPVVSVGTVTSASLTTWTVAADQLEAGVLHRADTTGGWPDEPITVTVTVGYFVPGANPDVDAPVVPLQASTFLAACELLRFWWQQGRQGPGFGGQPGSPGFVPQGFLIPERVISLLRAPDSPQALPGFA